MRVSLFLHITQPLSPVYIYRSEFSCFFCVQYSFQLVAEVFKWQTSFSLIRLCVCLCVCVCVCVFNSHVLRSQVIVPPYYMLVEFIICS